MYFKINKDKISVVILTEHLKITGTMHTLAHERLTDFMEAPSPLFLAITKATICHLSDGKMIDQPEFLCLNKHEVTAIYPHPEAGKS